ncbi:carbohydrate ABC transporter permease [Paenibacillus gansuensis]|uniref:Carbohydrate ABC transporter permease n=1 Tax=Paenibacillus gansuensis TaxID=306542 RepID=A0ABW5P7F7_9BACL
MNSWSSNKLLQRSAAHIVLIIAALFFAAPLLFMISISVKPNSELFDWPPKLIPGAFEWRNYTDALEYIPFFSYLWNTVKVALLATAGILFSCPMVAYSMARFQWRGSKLLFALTLGVMMLPFQVTMIPIFIFFKEIGWVDTYLPLWVPAFFGSPFLIFLLTQFFRGLPKELEDAARIDGANELLIYLRIMLPLCRPALLTVALFQFMGSWSDYIGPLIYLSDDTKYTVMLGLAAFRTQHGVEWQMLMATSMMVTVPIIVLYFFVQKSFIRGITFSGIK